MEAEDKLHKLGLRLLPVPTPVGAYLLAQRSGSLLFVSGTTCYLDNGKLLFTGRVGKELNVEQGYQAAQQTMLNLLSVVKAELGDLDRVERIIKLNGYVNSAPDFDKQPSVINGASDLLEKIYGLRGKHARTSIGVSDLPGHIPVEIEMVLEICQT
jgi:enamine deaminase RidA (YjgF/YER057c/UK114 family)